MHQSERATKLSGTAQAVLNTIDLPYQLSDRAEFDRHICIALDQLGEAAFEAIASEGRARKF